MRNRFSDDEEEGGEKENTQQPVAAPSRTLKATSKENGSLQKKEGSPQAEPRKKPERPPRPVSMAAKPKRPPPPSSKATPSTDKKVH